MSLSSLFSATTVQCWVDTITGDWPFLPVSVVAELELRTREKLEAAKKKTSQEITDLKDRLKASRETINFLKGEIRKLEEEDQIKDHWYTHTGWISIVFSWFLIPSLLASFSKLIGTQDVRFLALDLLFLCVLRRRWERTQWIIDIQLRNTLNSKSTYRPSSLGTPVDLKGLYRWMQYGTCDSPCLLISDRLDGVYAFFLPAIQPLQSKWRC